MPFVGDDGAVPVRRCRQTPLRAWPTQASSRSRRSSTLANWLGVAVALIPILVVLMFYLPLRIRFIRRATAGQRYLDAGADLDLFALRAMAHQPLHVLARIDADPAGAWLRGDAAVIDHLAGLELRSVGLRPPDGLSSRSGRAR